MLADRVDRIVAEIGLSGAVRIDRDGEIVFEGGYGLANRGLGVANSIDTQFPIASGSKGFTALTVMSWSNGASCRSTPQLAPCSAPTCR